MATSLAAVIDAYTTNADYDADNSRSKAYLFVAACRKLKVLLPNRSSTIGAMGTEVQFSVTELEGELSRALQWLRANPATDSTNNDPSVVYPDFTGFRG